MIGIFVFGLAKDMERVKKLEVWKIWLLLAVFTLPFVVKTVHIYHTEEHSEHTCCSDKSHSHHDCNNCLICQFTLSAFTEAAAVCYDFRVIYFDFGPIIFFQNNPYQQVTITYGLRAPPAA